ncbi:putative E3 ubiquitin-protein ligase RING1a [Dichanthelium oligosanthes]|uniref:Putative E3 ubiquitin-protein ligase RING1a n=1 Tax=Dichanthelium oligosanthes TaxID=888268 RepID=A0A1E5VEE6_9POAL|nr:putative E3 ubiquitin-protein ligase RING1a [Dichanthelium oligosanthes]
MPAQKRRRPSPSSKPRDHVAASGSDATADGGGGGVGEGRGGRPPLPSGGAAKRRLTEPKPQRGLEDDSDAEDGGGADRDSESSQSDGGGGDELMLVKLAEIRKEVQCPICLGIIQKTRAVMECLHRFCRDCIDKSMRLGYDARLNNECPKCRTHCASRRSLRDDPNYDALIAALYPDIDKYEEEELAFNEQEMTRNKKVSSSALAMKYRRNMRARGRGRTIATDIAPTGSDDEDREEENATEVTKEPSSADDHSPDLRQKRSRKRSASQASPGRTIGSSDHSFEENDELVGGKEILATSPLQEILATSPLRGEMLAWGKNGTRSQNRHGSASSNGRMGRSVRIAKLVDHLRTNEMNKEFHLYLVLLPIDGQSTPNLEKPYLSCRPTLSIQHLVKFIALQLSRKVEELEMYIRMDRHNESVGSKASSKGDAEPRPFDGLARLGGDKLLLELHPSFASSNGDLELLYALKTRD